MAKEIFESLPCFYQYAMQDTSIWTTNYRTSDLAKLKWSNNSAYAYAARESSLFHTHKPVIEYSEKTELNEPLSMSLTEMCAGLLGQVYFTLPLSQNANGQWVPSTLKSTDAFYSPYTGSATPNITALQDFMLKVSKEAFYSSPYYRHHAMRHLASNSTACTTFASLVEQNESTQEYTVLEESAYSKMDASYFQNFSIRRRGFMSNLLGSKKCFCGFVQPSKSTCQIPEEIVKDILLFGETLLPSTPDYAYLNEKIVKNQFGQFDLETENHIVQRTLSRIWLNQIWPCPQLGDLSDHWGFIKDANAWISGNESLQLNATDYLDVGYGGLRVGTMKFLKEQVREKWTPSHRTGMQNPVDGGPVTGHTRCQADESTMRPETLANHFIDDLFPASQGNLRQSTLNHNFKPQL